MKAIVCHAPEDLRLDTFDADAMGAHQLQVDVAYGGICGSDLHYYHHGGFGTVRIKEPMVLGHEVSGIVRVVGSAVQNFKAGQRIAISPSRPCGQCQYCQKGQHNHCLDMRFFGSAMRFPHVQGAFRQSLVIDASQAHPLNDSLSLSLAALAEPLSVGLHAIQRAGSVAVDIADKPLECARAMGADETINIAKHPEALAPFAVNKGVFGVMFEASGNDRALRSGLDVVAPRGVIVSIGLGGDSTLPLNQLVGKELELRGTFRFHEEFAVAVRFLNEGLIDGRPVISHVVDFDDALKAFDLASDKSQAMKVQINFGAEALA